jgi:threonine dehydratase
LAGFFVVEEWEIIEAMRFVYERLKLVIEPSSAVAVAPLLRQEPDFVGKKIGVIITGGNVDLSEFFKHMNELARVS